MTYSRPTSGEGDRLYLRPSKIAMRLNLLFPTFCYKKSQFGNRIKVAFRMEFNLKSCFIVWMGAELEVKLFLESCIRLLSRHVQCTITVRTVKQPAKEFLSLSLLIGQQSGGISTSVSQTPCWKLRIFRHKKVLNLSSKKEVFERLTLIDC